MKKRFLVVNVNWLGDALFSTPALRALRRKYPDAHIACLLPPRAAAVLKNNPNVNEIIEADDRVNLLRPFSFFKMLNRLRRGHFDIAIFFHGSSTKAWMAALAGIPERIGYATKKSRRLTRACPPPGKRLHKTDFFLNLLAFIGVPSAGREPDFVVTPEAERSSKALLIARGIGSSEPYVVAHAGGNWELKRWPVAHFARWAAAMKEAFPHRLVFCGSASERALSEEILKTLPAGSAVSLCGETSLEVLAALLKNAACLVSNDSGPIHLAASQKTPLLGLFGPTSAEETGPLSAGKTLLFSKDVGCEVPCYFSSCDTRVCMEWLTPEEVFEKTAELLK